MAYKLISPENEGKFVGSNRMSFFQGAPPSISACSQRPGDAEMQRKAIPQRKMGESAVVKIPYTLGPEPMVINGFIGIYIYTYLLINI